MRRTIGVVTTTRADYGLYRPIIRKLIERPDLNLRLYVTGTHLSEKFGMTVHEIEEDGFPIAARVPLGETGDAPQDIAEAMGRCTTGFAEVFNVQRPDILVVLGDRAEMHAAAVAAIPFRIPLAHIHGGELTYGAIDDYFRHSLTKLSSLHFISTQQYAQRVIQMGEEPWRVIVSGAPGLDEAMGMARLSKEEIERRHGVNCSHPLLLVSFHPVTEEIENAAEHINNMLAALNQFPQYTIVLSYPNADTGRDVIIAALEQYAQERGNARLVKSFGHQGYLSIMAYATAIVGNSSSGIIEAASFRLPVVNIGSRQQGRMRGKNVIDVGYRVEDIVAGINQAASPAFRASLTDLVNPYGNGHASERIVNALSSVDVRQLMPKKWYERNQ